ncbi:MAG: hypothetical protein SCALA702_17110 [Melioribacteraceae bacterium]|nr:MAG: hypothetical protein SCALA702_17110 [Melioribacteraceae bacterium]
MILSSASSTIYHLFPLNCAKLVVATRKRTVIKRIKVLIISVKFSFEKAFEK